MGFLHDLFYKPYPPHAKAEIERFIDELARIGRTDDFLSERPGGAFNIQCRHKRAREIGIRLDELGGIQLMEYILKKIQKRLNPNLASHLSYAWAEIGKWVP